MRRHAGEVRYRASKIWTTETARWEMADLREQGLHRDSLWTKSSKVNGEEIYCIEEVKEGRERWRNRKTFSQEDRLERARQISKENGESKKEDKERKEESVEKGKMIKRQLHKKS